MPLMSIAADRRQNPSKSARGRVRARPAPKPKILPAIRPSAGIQAVYRGRMDRLIAEMHKSIMYWITAAFRANEPIMTQLAQDAPSRKIPAGQIRKAMDKMARRWKKRFNDAAPDLADYFATAINKRTDAALKGALKKAGISVEFKMTRAAKDVMTATIGEQVGLIKSIPAEYLTQVQGHVMRAVQTGRDLGELTKTLEKQYGVTRRRASLIARDQNNKATSAMQEARRHELGIEEAIWLHSAGGRKPRPKHVAATGTRYKVGVGLPVGDKGQYVLPGEEINCRCVSRAVLPTIAGKA